MAKVINSDTSYLDGPNARGNEFWFSFKVLVQLLRGFRKLHFCGPCISVFGSARFEENHPDYQLARLVGKEIAKMGFTTLTGGGPGIMEAANRGAFENNGTSIGCTIKLPHEQSNNPYLHKVVPFDFFFIRKFLLLKYSYAFIVLPGGFGTLDELFETLTLIQTSMINNFPVVVMNVSYFAEIEVLVNKMIKEETISLKDAELLLFTDDIEKAMEHIKKFIANNYEIKSKKTKPLWFLGEQA